MGKIRHKITSLVVLSRIFPKQVSADINYFRFRWLCALHIQNLSNCCRHKYNLTISRVFKFIFWRICAIWLYYASPGTLKTGSYRQLFYHSFWLARLPNSCRVKLTREPMSKVETNRAMDWCLKNCVTRGEPIKTLFSSSNVLLACYKGFPWWKRRVELQPQIPPQRLQKWEEFAQCLCYFLIEFCSWNQL